jgi:hypothetical protein
VDIHDKVTVVPFNRSAVQAVTTPLFVFEQPFPVRAGRLERQVEALHRNNAVVLLTDVWPTAFHDPIHYGYACKIIKNYNQPCDRWDRAAWPETAMYQSDVGKMLDLDESIVYRPHMWLFGSFCDEIPTVALAGEEVDIASEAAITVDDRAYYAIPDPPMLKLTPSSERLTVIVIADRFTTSLQPALASLKQQTIGQYQLILVLCETKDLKVDVTPDAVVEFDGPTGAAVNMAIERATGERIAIMLADQQSVPNRFERQLHEPTWLSMSPIKLPDGVERWAQVAHRHTRFAERPTGSFGSMMIHRNVFDRIPGMHPTMHVGFEYDFFIRCNLNSIDMVVFDDCLVSGDPYAAPYGLSYTQQVYNDITRRWNYDENYHVYTA